MTLTSLSTVPGAVARAAGADSSVTPGVLGFTVVALLGVATYLLIRSMNRQIKRIDLPAPDETPRDETPPDEPVSGAADRP